MPKKIECTSSKNNIVQKIICHDKVRLPSLQELKAFGRKYMTVTPTDFALMCGAYSPTRHSEDSPQTSSYYLQTHKDVDAEIDYNGNYHKSTHIRSDGCLCPTVDISIPDKYTSDDNINVFNHALNTLTPIIYGDKISHYVVRMGQYPQTIASTHYNDILENLYNQGNIKQLIKPTGRLYTINSTLERGIFVPRYLPEYSFNGNRYVRYSKSHHSGQHSATWYKVEPVLFKIANWHNLPKTINPKGNGTDNYLTLISEKGLISNIYQHPHIASLESRTYNNSTFRGFLNGITLDSQAYISKDINIIKEDFDGIGLYNEIFHETRSPVVHFTLSKYQDSIPDRAFEGCISIENITIQKPIFYVGEQCFAGTKLQYLYLDKMDNVHIARSIPNEAHLGIPMRNAQEVIFYSKHPYEYFDIRKQLAKAKTDLPVSFLLKLNQDNTLQNLYNSDFRFFKNEMSHFPSFWDGATKEELSTFFTFAMALGCFSKKRLTVAGESTDIPYAQKASSMVSRMIRRYKLSIKHFHKIFWCLPSQVDPNEKVLKFLSQKTSGKYPDYLDMVMDLEMNGRNGIFAKLIADFNTAILYRNQISPDGKPEVVPWFTAISRFYYQDTYATEDEKYRDLAQLFLRANLSKEDFENAVRLRELAVETSMPAHILGAGLKEEAKPNPDALLEQIQDIQKSIQRIISNSGQNVKETHRRKFTYEWLDKYDPKNAIIGVYCSCCATIKNSLYGREIVESTMMSPDTQNIIVRDAEDNIVAKGTIYVNRKLGYAVINDFELNRKYRKDELQLSGWYYDESEAEKRAEENRAEIFEAFKRGVNDFVRVYDAQNPDNPIRQVNVGMGYNKLKRQCSKLEKSTLLKVPVQYSFEDASEEQRILYKRETTHINEDNSSTSQSYPKSKGDTQYGL